MLLKFQAIRNQSFPINVSSTTKSTGRRLNLCGIPNEDQAPQIEHIKLSVVVRIVYIVANPLLLHRADLISVTTSMQDVSKIVAELVSPPVVDTTKGIKVACSISKILCHNLSPFRLMFPIYCSCNTTTITI